MMKSKVVKALPASFKKKISLEQIVDDPVQGFNITPKDCRTLSGFSLSVMKDACRRLGFQLSDVFTATITAHMNTTWPQAEVIHGFWGDKRLDESTLRERATLVLEKAKTVYWGRPERRLDKILPNFPYSTFMQDGIPMPIRGSLGTFTGKSKSKVRNYQHSCQVDGESLNWSRKGVDGRIGDAVQADGFCSIPGGHFRNEQGLMDAAYMANAHGLTPFKAASRKRKREAPLEDDDDEEDEDEEEGLTPAQSDFGIIHRKPRTTIERRFGYLDRHRFLHYNEKSPGVADGQWNLINNLECLQWQEDEQNGLHEDLYPDVRKRTDTERQLFVHPCGCSWAKDDRRPADRPITAYKQQLADAFHAAGVVETMVNKRSANQALSRDSTYTPQTKAEIKAHFSENKHNLRQDDLRVAKERKQERKQQELDAPQGPSTAKAPAAKVAPVAKVTPAAATAKVVATAKVATTTVTPNPVAASAAPCNIDDRSMKRLIAQGRGEEVIPEDHGWTRRGSFISGTTMHVMLDEACAAIAAKGPLPCKFFIMDYMAVLKLNDPTLRIALPVVDAGAWDFFFAPFFHRQHYVLISVATKPGSEKVTIYDDLVGDYYREDVYYFAKLVLGFLRLSLDTLISYQVPVPQIEGSNDCAVSVTNNMILVVTGKRGVLKRDASGFPLQRQYLAVEKREIQAKAPMGKSFKKI